MCASESNSWSNVGCSLKVHAWARKNPATFGGRHFGEAHAWDSLPNAVKDSLLVKAGKGKLQNVESLSKHGKLVAYEADAVAQGRHREIQVGSSGDALHHKE